MAVMVAAIGIRSSRPVSLVILLVIVLLAALSAAGYYIGREYVNRRNWR
jgi:hypothetical protein